MIGFTQAGFALVVLLIVWALGRASIVTILAIAIAGASIGSIDVVADFVGQGLQGLAPLFNTVGGPVG